jgi:hypothetical protein
MAGAAHYSSVNVEPGTGAVRHRNSLVSRGHRLSDGGVTADRQKVMDDLQELYCCNPTLENLERRWRKDAVFEVSGYYFRRCDKP